MFNLLKLKRFSIEGESMLPEFKPGDRVVVDTTVQPKEGDVVVLRQPREDRLIVKRIAYLENGYYIVSGDNDTHSTDSRAFGRVARQQIFGKVKYKY